MTTLLIFLQLVLCLSVSLQMAGFFAMASTAMWLDKLSHLAGSVNIFHIAYYRAGFIVMVVVGFSAMFIHDMRADDLNSSSCRGLYLYVDI